MSEYIMHGCDNATINIYLQDDDNNDDENKFVKITRLIDARDHSHWKINNQSVQLKNVLEHIARYNIQVDNLCQFLPQDRVQEFAKLNQQQLLHETQLALCRDDLIEKQRALTAAHTNEETLAKQVARNSELLQEAQDTNIRLEGKVKNRTRKQNYLNQVQDIERKVTWIQYESLHERLVETKSDITKAMEVCERYRMAAEPMERKITKAKQNAIVFKEENTEMVILKCNFNKIRSGFVIFFFFR